MDAITTSPKMSQCFAKYYFPALEANNLLPHHFHLPYQGANNFQIDRFDHSSSSPIIH